MSSQLVLEQILSELKRLNAPKLGFVESPTALRIYANRSNPPHLWYTVQDGNAIALPSHSLCGYLRAITFEKVTRRNKEVIKMQVAIQGDRPYLIESGHDSHFAKGFLASVAVMTPAQVATPVTISVFPGEDESVLFCALYTGGESIKKTYDDDTNWRAIASTAQKLVRSANEQR